jgi:hypothetical protein
MCKIIHKFAILILLILIVPGTLFAQYRVFGSEPQSSTPVPGTFQITVQADVPIFIVFVDGESIKGKSARVTPGQHTITVRAPGLPDWEQRINVTGNQTIVANLRNVVEHQLSINSNIQGAQVYIDGNALGNTSFSVRLRPGTYEIRVARDGYQDYTATVTLNGNQDIYADLQPLLARVQVRFPAGILNTRDRGASGRVEIFVDGERRNGHSFQVTAGQHRIEIISGGFAIDQTLVFQAGREYTLEPSFGLSIR